MYTYIRLTTRIHFPEPESSKGRRGWANSLATTLAAALTAFKADNGVDADGVGYNQRKSETA